MIHEVIGCVTVAWKPTLSYKLSTATLKADSINLCSDSDWEGCIEDFSAAQRTKKASGNVISVQIIVPDQAC
jgi:hypothetical protein